MGNVSILYVGENEEIFDVVIRLLKKQSGYDVEGAKGFAEACSYAAKKGFDVVLLGSDLEDTIADRIVMIFNELNPGTKFIQHFGGGSGLLTNEINAVLENS